MKRRAVNLIPALGLALLLAQSGQVAEAGYVSSGLAYVRGDSTAIDLSTGAGASESTLPVQTFSFKSSAFEHAIIVPAQVNFGSSSGMTPPVQDSSTSQGDIAVHRAQAEFVLPLAAWLGAEGRSALPPPISSRFFRPPRFVD